MIKHKLFAKGETIYALISTTQNPNILFPVRATIYDVKFDDINPQYQIRIKSFYDTIYFLKHYMFGGRFIKNFEGSDTNGQSWKSYLLIVDSVFCTKTKAEQTELFNNINTFHIQIKLKELYELTNRSVYRSGSFYFHTRGEYVKALERFLGDKLPKDEKWIDNLLNRPDSSEMDGVEWV
jgi:hypothetical protein